MMQAYLRRIKDTVALKDALSVFIDNTYENYQKFSELMSPYAASMHTSSRDAMKPPYTQLAWFMDYFANTITPIKAALDTARMPDALFLAIVTPSLKKLDAEKHQFPLMLSQLSETTEAISQNQWGAVDTTAIAQATEHLRAMKSETAELLKHPILESMLNKKRTIDA